MFFSVFLRQYSVQQEMGCSHSVHLCSQSFDVSGVLTQISAAPSELSDVHRGQLSAPGDPAQSLVICSCLRFSTKQLEHLVDFPKCLLSFSR